MKQDYFEFIVDCALEDRIEYIYDEIFPGRRRYAFYWRFFVARLARFLDYSPIKVFLYRLVGMDIGEGVFISPEVFIDPHFPEYVKIDDHVILGQGARILTHEFDGKRYKAGAVRIGRGAIIGAYCLLRGGAKPGGIRIGEKARTAMSCVVTDDVPDHATARGAPDEARPENPSQG